MGIISSHPNPAEYARRYRQAFPETIEGEFAEVDAGPRRLTDQRAKEAKQ